MSVEYRVVEEWSAPTYCEHHGKRVLYDECDATIQALWVVSYDTEEQEIIEWLERFYADEDDEAEARAKELNEEGGHESN